MASDYDKLVADTLAERPGVKAILERRAQRARIVEALRALRKRKGLSQRRLAARTGWAQSFIARLESIADEQMPTQETVVRYAEACGAKVGLVFLDRDEGNYRVAGTIALTDDENAGDYLSWLSVEHEERALSVEFAGQARGASFSGAGLDPAVFRQIRRHIAIDTIIAQPEEAVERLGKVVVEEVEDLESRIKQTERLREALTVVYGYGSAPAGQQRGTTREGAVSLRSGKSRTSQAKIRRKKAAEKAPKKPSP